ncbi:uncharacterized protein BDW47DRAFT_122667 [Aspergillus candidus]|uniref:Uncharacterized protein n=1 Tax=Aspergillus candidus TaxID=41067 RepID=A0A2I2FLX9_ASPCN|nr:hypothetical protein BDW47DRAFT_122667 [Aspergillus candidus]PLB41629.1 hypothetical protein BDW47DRAFT_122667 [Aspergillus candidus]
MKPTTFLLPLLPLTLAKSTIFNMAAEDKTCTPSFDYCADELIKSKGFSKSDLKNALKDSDVKEEDLSKILFHCKNPGDVGHPKVCQGGCKKGEEEEESHSC